MYVYCCKTSALRVNQEETNKQWNQNVFKCERIKSSIKQLRK